MPAKNNVLNISVHVGRKTTIFVKRRQANGETISRKYGPGNYYALSVWLDRLIQYYQHEFILGAGWMTLTIYNVSK